MVQVAERELVYTLDRPTCGLLLQRIRDECENFLVLVQQEHSPQVAKSLVCKARGRQKFETFYLAKMRPFAECEKI